MNSFEMTRRFHVAFGLGAPNKPIEPTVEDRILRAKLLLEETLETIEKGLGLSVVMKDYDPGASDGDRVTDRITIGRHPYRAYDPVETLDGIADVKVIANGTGVLFGLPVDVADRLVYESNMSKLGEDGKPIVNRCRICDGELPGLHHYCEDNLIDPTQPIGKVLKGPNYKKVDLGSILEFRCDIHTASSHDPKVCGKCGTYIDSLREVRLMDWNVIPDTYWYYKDQVYRVIGVRGTELSQDSLGNWVATVNYEREDVPNKTFLRAITDFTSKFQPRDMAR